MSNSNQNKHNQGKPNKHNQGKPTKSRVEIEKTKSSVSVSGKPSGTKPSDFKVEGDSKKGNISAAPKSGEAPSSQHVAGSENPSRQHEGLNPTVGETVKPNTETRSEAPTTETRSEAPESGRTLDFQPIRKEHEGDLVGRFVKLGDSEFSEHYVTYSSGDGQWHLAHGLGKKSCYVIIDDDITKVSPKVKLSLSTLFPKAFTYLTDGNAVFQLVRVDGQYSMRVCGFAKSVTGWYTVEDSIAFLYQLPHSNPGSQPVINVFAQSDGALGANAVLKRFQTLNLDVLPETSVVVSEVVEHIEDFAAEDFLVKFF